MDMRWQWLGNNVTGKSGVWLKTISALALYVLRRVKGGVEGVFQPPARLARAGRLKQGLTVATLAPLAFDECVGHGFTEGAVGLMGPLIIYHSKEIGRASCRERGWSEVVGGWLKT